MGLADALAFARKACLDISCTPLVLIRKVKTKNTKTGGYTEGPPIELPAQDCRLARPSYRVLHPLPDMVNGNGMLYDWIVMFDVTNADVLVGDSFVNPHTGFKCEVRVVDKYLVNGRVAAMYAMAIEVRA